MNHFFDPKSTLTPAIAAALMVFISKALFEFFPELEFRWLALCLSFLIGGLVIIASASMKWYEYPLYWILNSLVIFAIGVGTSEFTAHKADVRAQERAVHEPASASSSN